MSLSLRQLGALARAATLELIWGLPAVADEVSAWRARALQIPDPAIREDALSSLARKRASTDGAALFWTIPHTRSRQLLRVLVTYEILLDFLDSVSERGAQAGLANGRQLHLALAEALDPNRQISDHYRHNPRREDGGYLRALVETCRASCTQLPSYEHVRRALVEEATRAQVLGINHELDPILRDAALRDWAVKERCEKFDVSWFELTGAASASLTVHALLTLAAGPSCTELDIERIRAAYYPWVSVTTTMLDSYVDQGEDVANGDHSYIAHYPTAQFAAQRIRQLIQRSFLEAHALPNSERHALVVACMIAMYLSKDSALTQATRATTVSLLAAAGDLTKLLLPILRLWRIAYALRAA